MALLRFGSILLAVAFALSLGRSSAWAERREEHRVLAAGQFVLGGFWRDREQRRLTIDPFGEVAVRDARFEGWALRATADVDLQVENTLSDEAVVDFTNRIRAEYDSPDDLQGGRYRFLDNRFRAVWGIALDPETTMRSEAKLRTYYDVLFPELTANTGEIALTFDSELDRNAWLTFGFSGQGTIFAENASDDYFEGSARATFQWYAPRSTSLTILPAPVEFPRPRETDDVFRYSAELGLHESKKLFPLGAESLIGKYTPPPLEVSKADRLFAEKIDSEESFSALDLWMGGRGYQGDSFPDFRRVEGSALHKRRLRRGLFLQISDTAGYLAYAAEDPSRFFADRTDNRFKAELVRTRRTSRLSGYGSYALFRFPNSHALDYDAMELGLRSLWQFGKRYWSFSDFGFTWIDPAQPRDGYPREELSFWNVGFTVNFTPIQYLTLSGRWAEIRIPRFETFFDNANRDLTGELRYHHQIQKHVAVEGGYRYFDRKADNQPDDARQESLVFGQTVLDL